MLEVAVIGSSEFVLGFQLAGVKRIIELEEKENPEKKIMELKQDPAIGIIITDARTMEKLNEYRREEIQASVKPVVVVLSIEAEAQDALRKMILKSIGVDLWG
ncbi:V-type ATP synthase subunit F [Candidatus Woesearchaeota archaeon]|nr:V-type ATP synthase subunit F [Candidatus Woesearchaeota archaeon]